LNLTFVSRHVLMRRLALLFALSLLAVALVSLPLFHAKAQHAPKAHVVAPPSAAVQQVVKHYEGDEADGSIPSWDIMTLAVTVRCFS
jgi:hypothetical protein